MDAKRAAHRHGDGKDGHDKENAHARGDGCGVNVVEQQNAFAARLKPVHRQRNDLLRRDTMVPVIRHRVGAEVNEYLIKPGAKKIMAFRIASAD